MKNDGGIDTEIICKLSEIYQLLKETISALNHHAAQYDTHPHELAECMEDIVRELFAIFVITEEEVWLTSDHKTYLYIHQCSLMDELREAYLGKDLLTLNVCDFLDHYQDLSEGVPLPSDLLQKDIDLLECFSLCVLEFLSRWETVDSEYEELCKKSLRSSVIIECTHLDSHSRQYRLNNADGEDLLGHIAISEIILLVGNLEVADAEIDDSTITLTLSRPSSFRECENKFIDLLSKYFRYDREDIWLSRQVASRKI